MDILSDAGYECPYCGEWISTTVDTSQGDYETIEDCSVCCRPIQLTVRCEPGEIPSIDAQIA